MTTSPNPNRRLVLFLLGMCITLACGKVDDAAPAATPQTPPTIDSIVPREVELARFRSGLDSISELNSDFRSRDAIVAAFVARLAARDTSALVALALTKSEFAWIYFPTNPVGLPPYELGAGLMWFRLDGNSRKGLLHALEERGGGDLKVVGYACESVTAEGENRIHNRCALKKLQAPGDTVAEVLFGGIIERHGRFKLVSFTNKL